MSETPAYPDEPASIGIPLITEAGVAKPHRIQHGRTWLAIWAHVAGKQYGESSTDAERATVWGGRVLSIQGSPNGYSWSTVVGLDSIQDDFLDIELAGNLHYRVVVTGSTGGDLSGLRASMSRI